jgi:hypothetical protein
LYISYKFILPRFNLLEIGAEDKKPFQEKSSKCGKVFPFENIYSIDIYDKSSSEERIKIFQGSRSLRISIRFAMK